ncbi:response regulator transcription factor [Gorillibacterium sp. sgz5001074]|uniref:response regulator transcription factor n=1 Tax=Gorillibacterium sp. sgz5001074 TaxID=3446695 RepID=UPI003F67187F
MTRILLVEDDELLAEGLIFALTKELYETDRAGSVAEAKAHLAASPYDLALLDVMLPDGTGFELCRHVRSFSRMPILFLTACDEEVNVVQGLELGGDDYITKPFRLRELLSRIKAILRRAQPHESQADAGGLLSAGAVTLRLLDTKVFKHGTEVNLTPVEFRLLALLLKHPGMTLTRAQLLDKLWDEQGEFVDDNTLSVHVRRLREKLEDDPSHPQLITTVRGIGYRLETGGAGHHV